MGEQNATAVDEAPTRLTTAEAQAFWAAFLTREEALAGLPARDFVQQANELLQTFAPRLALEVEGKDDAGPRGLVVSAHGDKARFPDVLTLVAQAPDMRLFSSVTAFRLRATNGDFAIGMEGFRLSTGDIQAQLSADRGLVGLTLRFDREIPMDMADHARHMAFIMLDHVIGEYDFAVRVGGVDFVEAFADDTGEPVRLSRLSDAFDRFWQSTLGRTGVLPADESQLCWDLLELSPQDEDGRPDIMTLSRSADALATRADLAFCLDVEVDVGGADELERARDLQDALEAFLQREGRGVFVLSLVRMDEGRRLCRFYVESDQGWFDALEGLCRAHGFDDPSIDTWFDPSWDAYLAYWSAGRE